MWWLAGYEHQQDERKLGAKLRNIHGLLLGNMYIVLDCIDAKDGWGQWYFPKRELFHLGRHKWHGGRCEGFGDRCEGFGES